MNVRLAFSALLLLAVLTLAGCVPSPLVSTMEEGNQSGSFTETTKTLPANITSTTDPSTDTQTQAEEIEQEPGSDQLLVAPTLALTATPGIVHSVVEQVVEGTGLEDVRFIGLSSADWINLAISLFLVFLTLTLIARVIFYIFKKITRRTATPYDEIYLDSIKSYLRWLFGVIVLYIGTMRLQFLSPEFKQWMGQIFYIFLVGLIVICLWKLVDVFALWYQEKIKDHGERDGKEAVQMLAERTIRFLLVLVGVLVVLDHIGFNISALLAAVGIGGLAFSLAAQDTIANMISGVIILTDQPFRVGDRIEIQELKTWGDVVSIGLRSTRIRTRDNRLVIVPNSSISNNQVVNYTFPDPRYRIQTDIGVGYGTNLRIVRELITDALQGVEGIIPDKPVDILFLEFGDSEMVLRVRWWIDSYIDARRSTDRVNETIYTALEQAGIDMPYPTMTVEIKKNVE